ncbi:MAG: hypothetical protein RI973_732 [Bacteroidota bacterium]|jgi:tRNA threonylcarbamoyladenosine biosynthesis protein TsaB
MIFACNWGMACKINKPKLNKGMARQVPIILNLETATEVCSVCVSRGEEVLALESAGGANDHGRVVTLLISSCLRVSGLEMRDLQAVAVSGGPGSYTSLRVGASVAKGICYALDLPLIAVDTLQSLARAAALQLPGDQLLYCPMIDARRMEVYCALFDGGSRRLTATQPHIVTEASFEEYFSVGRRLVFIGNGAPKCQGILPEGKAVFLPLACDAIHLVHFSNQAFLEGNYADLAYFAPNYLKAPNITQPGKSSFPQ